MKIIESILAKKNFDKEDLIRLFQANEYEQTLIFKKASEIKQQHVSNQVFIRGLIEISNVCQKDCFYCGIRKSNQKTKRYALSEKEIKNLIQWAYQNNYRSLVIQSGELNNPAFTEKISRILSFAKTIHNKTGITLSCGEQKEKIYQKWMRAGAERYLLRIETSNRELYNKIHPNDALHDFDQRLKALGTLKKTGYQTGTGIMIGLPFQTLENLAEDLLFMQETDIDMCGMGPYIEHPATPLFRFNKFLPPLKKRAELTLLAIALLRIMMKNINIAATTALNTIASPYLFKGIKAGANVIMPNLTPEKHQNDYLLYQNKNSINRRDRQLLHLSKELKAIDHEIAYKSLGTSMHFSQKNSIHVKV